MSRTPPTSRTLLMAGLLLCLGIAASACDDTPPPFVCGEDDVDCWFGQTMSFERATCACIVEIDEEVASVSQCLDVVFDGGPTTEQANCLREVVAEYPESGDSIRCFADILGDIERCIVDSGCDTDTIDCLNFEFRCDVGSEAQAEALIACGDLFPNLRF